MDITIPNTSNGGFFKHLMVAALLLMLGWIILHNQSNIPPDVMQACTNEVSYTPSSPDDPGRWRFKNFKEPKKWFKQLKQRGFSIQRISNILKNGKPKNYTHPTKGPQGLKIVEDPATGDYIIYEKLPTVNEVWQIAPNTFLH